jgi:hypothetical protein
MLDSEMCALAQPLLALCSVSSISPAHTPADTAYLHTMLKNELCRFVVLYLISNISVIRHWVNNMTYPRVVWLIRRVLDLTMEFI